MTMISKTKSRIRVMGPARSSGFSEVGRAYVRPRLIRSLHVDNPRAIDRLNLFDCFAQGAGELGQSMWLG